MQCKLVLNLNISFEPLGP